MLVPAQPQHSQRDGLEVGSVLCEASLIDPMRISSSRRDPPASPLACQPGGRHCGTGRAPAARTAPAVRTEEGALPFHPGQPDLRAASWEWRKRHQRHSPWQGTSPGHASGKAMPGQKGGGAGQGVADGQRGNKELLSASPPVFSILLQSQSLPEERQMMGLYLPGVSHQGCSGWAPHRGAALPRCGAPRRQRHRQGGRRPSRRPASASCCRGAARGCSWHSQSEGRAGEGKSYGGLSASLTPSSLTLPRALCQW